MSCFGQGEIEIQYSTGNKSILETAMEKKNNDFFELLKNISETIVESDQDESVLKKKRIICHL